MGATTTQADLDRAIEAVRIGFAAVGQADGLLQILRTHPDMGVGEIIGANFCTALWCVGHAYGPLRRASVRLLGKTLELADWLIAPAFAQNVRDLATSVNVTRGAHRTMTDLASFAEAVAGDAEALALLEPRIVRLRTALRVILQSA